MEFTPVNTLHISLELDSIKGTQTLAKNLQLGQVVTATVISNTAQGQSFLKINGELLSAATDKLLAAGETLNLKVAQLPTLPFAKALNVPIQQLSQAHVSLLMTAPEPVLKTWQAGSVLQAMILEQKPGGQTLLDISGRLLQADANQLLTRGQSIAIQLNNLSNPVLARIVAESVLGEALTGVRQDGKSGGSPLQAGASLNMAITPGLRLQIPPALMSQLQAGQQLEATVTAAMNNGKSQLMINGVNVNALTSLPLAQGQALSLQLVDLGKPAILVPLEAVTPENQIHLAMRQLLPQQSGLPEVISSLTALAQPIEQLTTVMDKVNPTVGEQLRFLARQILQQLPRTRDTATAAGIKTAIRQAGTLLENQLASSVTQQQPLPANDLKANLLRLLAFLQRQLPNAPAGISGSNTSNTNTGSVTATRIPSPPLPHSQPQAQGRAGSTIAQQANTQALLNELLRQVTGSLARIQLHQLASIGAEDETRQVHLTEVPIRHDHGTDVFHIRIEEDRHQKQKPKREKTWSVSLAFDIGKFGPIHVKLSLIKNVINTTFWAEQESTKQLIDSQLDILHQNFVKSRLGIGHMVCHHGTPPQPLSPKSQASYIVDIQA